jgi:hypothetical protein
MARTFLLVTGSSCERSMEEGGKRVLGIIAGILVARHLKTAFPSLQFR